MCGFVGTIVREGTPSKDILARMAQKIRHRGPDATEVALSGQVGLGFCRLGILDLNARSNQPMYHEPTGTWIVFNGEIYNYIELREELKGAGHIFVTTSDTEVLLHAYLEWKEEAFQRLRGMFACAIVQGNRVVFGRDAFGIKPLYYGYTDRGDMIFASELKALVAHPDCRRDVDTDILFAYMQMQHAPDDRTFLQGVSLLPQGSYAVVDDVTHPEDFVVHPYFQFAMDESITSLEDAVSSIQAAVKESVCFHKRADVKLGTFLSGGIDSSYITALTMPEKTFSVGFREGEGKFDESVHAKELSKILGIENVTQRIDKADVLQKLPEILYMLDEPQANLSSIPLYFLSALAREHVTVVLSGEGADELFGGYEAYLPNPSLDTYRKLPKIVRKSLAKASGVTPSKIRHKLTKGALEEEDCFVGEAYIATDAEVLLMLQNDVAHGKRAREFTRAHWVGHTALQAKQQVDLHHFMQRDILLKGDRMSMAHSLELRVPFLDVGVYDVASHLSDGCKIHGDITKYALRRAAEEVLPKEWFLRPKKGFPVPMRYWLREDAFVEEFSQVLLSDEAKPYFRLDVSEKMLEEHREGRALHHRKLYAAYVFVRWIESHILKGGTV